MPFGLPRLIKAFGSILLVATACGCIVSCGSSSSNSSSSSNTKHVPSGIKFRAFVSNPLAGNTAGSNSAALNIIDASRDLLSTAVVNLSGSVSNAGFMALAPDKEFTLVFSPGSNSVAVVDNTNEVVQSIVSLPGPTNSMFVWVDNQTGYAAVPSAAPLSGQGQSPGAVIQMNLPNSSVSATIPVIGAQYVIGSHDGSRILAFGSNPQAITLISPSQIGGNTDPRTVISSPSFDHPVWAIFSSNDSTAYILNCGPECGGVSASIAVLDMTQTPPQITSTIAVPAATYGILNGSTLYIAGTSSGSGTLTVISTASNSVLNSAPIGISDGYHNRMAISLNGELFIGARTCTAGCLSIFNPASGVVVLPAATGDVTGIQPITGRNVAYVCQGGGLNIYDTVKNVLQTTQVGIVGQAVDVELVDTP